MLATVDVSVSVVVSHTLPLPLAASAPPQLRVGGRASDALWFSPRATTASGPASDPLSPGRSTR